MQRLLPLTQYPQYPKSTGPKLSKVILRPRLFGLLDRARKGPVIWITGPPGSGKTTLVASYIKSRGLPGVWYQIDGRDADPATFFYYLKLAVDGTATRRHPTLPVLGSEYQAALPAFAGRFFGNLSERFGPSCAVVFDNYQNLADDLLVNYMISEGMDHVPDRGAIIVLSRAGPGPAFARLRASGKLTLLGWEDLKFTEKETAGFVRLYTGKGLSRQTVRAMHNRTNGWAAGMALMIDHIKRSRVPLDEAKNALSLAGWEAQETIFSYFEGEVYGRLDDNMREFLLTSAFLPRMTLKTVEQLTGSKDAGRLLSKLVRSSSFISRYHAREPFYQYHDLFLDFLRAKAVDHWSSDTLGRVRRSAAKALSDTGQTEDAIGLYLQAGDWAQAARLITGEAPGLIDKGRFRTLEAWLLGLPEEVLEKDPRLLYCLGASRMLSDPADSLQSLHKAYRMFKEDRDPAGMYDALVTIMEVFIISSSDATAWGQWIEEFKELNEKYPGFPSHEVELKASYSIYVALLFHDPRDPGLVVWAEKIRTLLTKIPDPLVRMRYGSMLFLYYSWTGDFFNAGVLVDMFHALVRSGDTPPPTRLMGYIMECNYLWTRGDTDACLGEMEEALAIGNADTIHILDHFLLEIGVGASLTGGSLKNAADILKRMAAAADPFYRFSIIIHHHLRGWYDVLTGDLSGACNYAEEGLTQAREAGVPFYQALLHLELAYIHIEDGRYRESLSHLADAHDIAVGMKSMHLEYFYLMTRAWYGFAGGNEAQALNELAQALALGKKQGFAVTLVFSRTVLADIYNRALDAGIETDYVKGVIGKLDLAPPDRDRAAAANWPYKIKVNTLGGFALFKDDVPVTFAGKVQKKPLDMLKAIVSFGGKDITEERISDALWPNADGDRAHSAFGATLNRLRRLLGNDSAVGLHKGLVTLDTGYCRVDAFAVGHAIVQAEDAWKLMERAGSGSPLKDAADDALRLTDKAIALYTGDFLASDTDQVWTASRREHLKSKIISLLSKAGSHYERTGQWNKALGYFNKGLEMDSLLEGFYREIMRCHLHLGQKPEAIKAYSRCRDILSSVMGITPSSMTEELYRQIIAP